MIRVYVFSLIFSLGSLDLLYAEKESLLTAPEVMMADAAESVKVEEGISAATVISKAKFSGVGFFMGLSYSNYVNILPDRMLSIGNVFLNLSVRAGGDAYIGLSPDFSIHLGFLELSYSPVLRKNPIFFFEAAPLVLGLHIHNITKNNDFLFLNIDFKSAFYGALSHFYLGPRVAMGLNLSSVNSDTVLQTHILRFSVSLMFHVTEVWEGPGIKTNAGVVSIERIVGEVAPEFGVYYNLVISKNRARE